MPTYPAQSACGGETSERERRSGRERVEFVLRVRVAAMMRFQVTVSAFRSTQSHLHALAYVHASYGQYT